MHAFGSRHRQMMGAHRRGQKPSSARVRPLASLGMAALMGLGSTVAWGAFTAARAGAVDGPCSIHNIRAGANCSYANLSDVNLGNHDLKDVNFSRADLSFSDFHHADLVNADLSHANLTGANLASADLTGAKLPYINGERAYFGGAKLGGASFYQATLTGSRGGANFNGAQLQGSNFDRANATGADFSKAQLEGSALYVATFNHANFNDANLANDDVRSSDFEHATFHRSTLTSIQTGRINIFFGMTNIKHANFLDSSGLAVDDNVLTCQTVLRNGNTISRNC